MNFDLDKKDITDYLCKKYNCKLRFARFGNEQDNLIFEPVGKNKLFDIVNDYIILGNYFVPCIFDEFKNYIIEIWPNNNINFRFFKCKYRIHDCIITAIDYNKIFVINKNIENKLKRDIIQGCINYYVELGMFRKPNNKKLNIFFDNNSFLYAEITKVLILI